MSSWDGLTAAERNREWVRDKLSNEAYQNNPIGDGVCATTAEINEWKRSNYEKELQRERDRINEEKIQKLQDQIDALKYKEQLEIQKQQAIQKEKERVEYCNQLGREIMALMKDIPLGVRFEGKYCSMKCQYIDKPSMKCTKYDKKVQSYMTMTTGEIFFRRTKACIAKNK